MLLLVLATLVTLATAIIARTCRYNAMIFTSVRGAVSALILIIVLATIFIFVVK